MKNRTVSGAVSEFFRSQPSFTLSYGRVFLALHPRGQPRGIRAEENNLRLIETQSIRVSRTRRLNIKTGARGKLFIKTSCLFENSFYPLTTIKRIKASLRPLKPAVNPNKLTRYRSIKLRLNQGADDLTLHYLS